MHPSGRADRQASAVNGPLPGRKVFGIPENPVANAACRTDAEAELVPFGDGPAAAGALPIIAAGFLQDRREMKLRAHCAQ